MNLIKYLLLTSILCNATSCVQESYSRHVKLTLDVSAIKNIQSVGIRGNGQPLSWTDDYPMTAVVKDSLYSAIITTKTGYKFCEFKFTINGDFELEGRENRRVYFVEDDTTNYHAVYEKEYR